MKISKAKHKLEDLGDVELPHSVEADMRKAVAEAEAQLDANRVNMRWEGDSLNIVKEVARIMGVPYQTYIKLVASKQAAIDLAQLKSAQSIAKNQTENRTRKGIR